MKVYQVRVDANHYQSLYLTDERLIEASGQLDMDCRSRIDTWVPPDVFCLRPHLKQGDFIGYGVGTLVVRKESLPFVQEFFEMAGELLPIYHEGQEWCLLNITECINCLDRERSVWRLTPEGERLSVKQFAFHPNRFTESSLFKIPETCRGMVLTVERSGDPEEEFKAAYEENHLSGLVFELLWEDENHW